MTDTSTVREPDDLTVHVETVKEDNLLRVVLRGESDVSTTTELDQALQRVELDGVRLVHLDLTDLTFADVAAVRRLAAFAGSAKRTGHDVTTGGAHPTLRTVALLLDVQGDLGLG